MGQLLINSGLTAEYDKPQMKKDIKARDELISIINSPIDAKNAQKTGSKHQRELKGMILAALSAGNISQKDASDIYAILNRQNLVAWEDEFLEIHQEYRIHPDAGVLLSSLRTLFQRYKIEKSRHEKRRYAKLNPKDLIVIGYEFLSPAGQTAMVHETGNDDPVVIHLQIRGRDRDSNPARGIHSPSG